MTWPASPKPAKRKTGYAAKDSKRAMRSSAFIAARLGAKETPTEIGLWRTLCAFCSVQCVQHHGLFSCEANLRGPHVHCVALHFKYSASCHFKDTHRHVDIGKIGKLCIKLFQCSTDDHRHLSPTVGAILQDECIDSRRIRQRRSANLCQFLGRWLVVIFFVVIVKWSEIVWHFCVGWVAEGIKKIQTTKPSQASEKGLQTGFAALQAKV